MDDLSDEVLLNIMRYLDKKSLINLGRTCHRYNDVSRDISLWKNDILCPYATAEIRMPSGRGKFDTYKLMKCRRCDNTITRGNGSLNCCRECEICERLVCKHASRVSIFRGKEESDLFRSSPSVVSIYKTVQRHVCLDCLHKIPRKILLNPKMCCDKLWEECQSSTMNCCMCNRIAHSCTKKTFKKCSECKRLICKHCYIKRYIYKDDNNVSVEMYRLCLACDEDHSLCDCNVETCFCSRFYAKEGVLILGKEFFHDGATAPVCKACYNNQHTYHV